MLLNSFLLILFFCLLWIGSGLVVNSVEKFASRLHLSSFSLSFFVLGFLTSSPEIFLGANSVLRGTPNIFVGNLIGSVVVLFLLVMPVFAIFGKGIKMSHDLNLKQLLLILLVIISPTLFLMDHTMDPTEGAILIILYIILFLFIERKQSNAEKLASLLFKPRMSMIKQGFLLVVGFVFIMISANQILDKTLYFSNLLGISQFIMSLIFLSLGTNLPEITLGIRSLLSKDEDVALGDYLGSAAANTPIIGFLSMCIGKPFYVEGNILTVLAFLVLSLVLFLIFSRTKKTISRPEGLIMLSVYVVFIIVTFVLPATR